ncbi:MAG TPA: amidohydrolase family protein [Kofleriaceae bacterium]|jgi:cytosine/adenosine deaminase-related metal-dependent hydrolase
MRAQALVLALGMVGCAQSGTDSNSSLDNAVTSDDATVGDIVINEFTAGNTGKIELYNASDAPVSLVGWQVDDIADGGTKPKALTGTLDAHAVLLVPYSGINTASADQVRVVDPSGDAHDTHASGWAGTSIGGQCFGREYDGGPWALGAITCSLGSTNGAPPPPPVTTGIQLVSMPRRDKVLLQGTIVQADHAFVGEVLVEGDTITCVAESCFAPDAAVVHTDGLIVPGLLNAHDHILFDMFDESDWSPSKAYTNHNQWPNDVKYKALVDAKQYLNGEGSPISLGCEMDKYGELKHLIAGTTSIQGSANPTDKACFGSVARTIDTGANGLGEDHMQTATIFPTQASADGVCRNFTAGRTTSYVIHIAEGTDAIARRELTQLASISTTPECLYSPHTTIVHGTALQDGDLNIVAQHGMNLVWSPRSNTFLYGTTTDIPLALSKGINVALAPDWSIGGSHNMLDELRFADELDNTEWGDQLSPQQLFAMVTINAARALGVGDKLGSLEVGKKADLFIIPGTALDPYNALLKATPADMQLVMVGGVAMYGDAAVAPLANPLPASETMDVCGTAKFVGMAQPTGTASNKLGQSFADVRDTLTNALSAYDAQNLTPYKFSPIAPLFSCDK